MSEELMRKMETQLQGSLKDLVKASETVMLLIDTSGSMMGEPIVQLREVVRGIMAQGHVPMIAFGGPYDAQVRFVDVVPEPDGGTPLHLAIPFAQQYGANRLVVISDGLPDFPADSMAAAKAFGGRIDVVYVGRSGRDEGSVFLDALARSTGGQRFNGDLSDTKALTGKVIGLLEGEVAPARAPIQGPGFTAEESIDAEEVGTEDEDDFEDEDEEDD